MNPPRCPRQLLLGVALEIANSSITKAILISPMVLNKKQGQATCGWVEGHVPNSEIVRSSFAQWAEQCDNISMPKSHFCALTLLAAGIFFTGHAAAQQTPASTTPKSSAATTTPAPKTQTPPAAKKPAAAPAAKTPAPLTLTTPKDKTSYAIGLSVGKNIGKGVQEQSLDIDQAILLRGMKDGLAGGKSLLTDEEVAAVLTELQKEARLKQEETRKKQEEIAKAQGEVNKKLGAAFLAENKTKEGVMTLPSGLQYKILQPGTGAKPTAADTVVCNYRGTLIDGKEFDSSYKRGQPATFPVGQVIKGWTEALQLMPVGSKWQLFLPPDLAYGERSAGPDITPNSTLIFEVELVSIKPPEKPAEKPAASPADKPAANPADKAPADKPIDTPAAKPADKPSAPDASTEKPKP